MRYDGIVDGRGIPTGEATIHELTEVTLMPKGSTKEKRGQSADYEAATKPGKLKKGRMVDGEVVYDEDEEDEEDESDDEEDEDEEDDTDDEDSEDEDDESDDEDDEDDEEEDDEEEEEEPAPKKKGKEKDKAAAKSTKKDDEAKLKPSQKPVLPAEKRKVSEEKIAKNTKVITVKDLEEEFGMDGKKIRRVIRALGWKAPEVKGDPSAFGAKKKYEWASTSPTLKAIRKALKEEQEG